ncbi:extracellular solute-binding protein [Streptomyces sp. NPDC059740]|uniref:extracellular solute-binding protein n=1 Tax=Streptomyces sp. NPDC059740 TaxID=3346926 RepID=UPI0036498027
MAVRRRYLGATAAGVATVFAFSLTSCSTPFGDDEVTLKLVAADYGDGPANSSTHYWAALTKAFEKKNPDIKVDVDVYNWKDVDRKVADLVKAGHAPDMAQAGAYADYAAADKLYSADDLLSIPVQGDIVASLAQAGEYHETEYGMPFAASTRRLFYNKKLFAEAGIAHPPQTWSEVARDAQLLKDHGVAVPFGLPLGPEETQAETMMWMLGGGGSYTDTTGGYAINSTDNIRTFEWVRDHLVKPGLTGTAPATTNRQDSFNAFTAGKVGMLDGHPTLIRQAAAKGLDYGTAPLPGINGNGHPTLGVSDWMMAFKQPDHRQQVGKFLDFVYRKENVEKFSAEYNLLPVTSSASQAMAADDRFRSLHGFLTQLGGAEFYPADKTTWPMVSRLVKARMGKAVAPDGNPAGTLNEIQKAADEAEQRDMS